MSTTAADFAFNIQLAIAGALLNALVPATYNIAARDFHLHFAKNEDDPYEGVVPGPAIETLAILQDEDGNQSAIVTFPEYTGDEPADLWRHGDEATQELSQVIGILSAAFETTGTDTTGIIKKAVAEEMAKIL